MSFIQVCEEEGEETMELPLENDGTLLVTTLAAQFPGACGLKYRHSETRTLRGVRLVDDHLVPPDEGWGCVFICSFPKENKRKIDDHSVETSSTKKRMEGYKCLDLIVLGLPYKTSEEELKQYFEQYGELLMAQIKKDPKTGQSKGFGFIRFANYESQQRALLQRHMIDGRVCDVKIPNSKEGMYPSMNSKVFIGRCTEEITTDDLREYFTKFGEVTDVFIPKPFRAFAFVTFLDPEVANMLCGEDHIIKGASVYVSSASPKQERSYGPPPRGGGPGRGSGGPYNNGGGWNGGGGYNNPSNMYNNGWGGPQGGGPMNNWNKQNPNMGPNMAHNMSALTMPMLAALSQASMGLLGSMQQQQQQQQQQGGPDGGYQGNQGGWQPQGNQGGGWDNQGGGNQGGRNDRYNR